MHFQDSLLCKWKQGEKRNCPYHGTCDNQRNYPQFSCKQSVTKAIWDAKGNRAIGKSKICLSFGHNEKRVVPWRLCASCHLGEPPQCFQWYQVLFFPKHCVHKDTARYVSSYSKPFKLLLKEQTNCPPKSGNFTDNNFNLSKQQQYMPIIHFF